MEEASVLSSDLNNLTTHFSTSRVYNPDSEKYVTLLEEPFCHLSHLYVAGHPFQSQTRSLNLNKVFSSVFISYYNGRFGQWQVTDPVVQWQRGEPRHCN